MDPPVGLIAPPYFLRIPELDESPASFRFATEGAKALEPAAALAQDELLTEADLNQSRSTADAIRVALENIVREELAEGQDRFSIEISVMDRLDEYRKPEGEMLFFVWRHEPDPQYIPLRPVFDRLEDNPLRIRLMATLYDWLYRTAQKVCDPFGLPEAANVYSWRHDAYLSAREDGEDVDLEGEVEFADPSKVVEYILDSEKFRLKRSEIDRAVSSIADLQLRDAFKRAHAMYRKSLAIRLPKMSKQCAKAVDDAAYYMDAGPMPGLGISHWRDDPIVAWLDEYAREQYEAGIDARAPIILGFHPRETKYFLQIIGAVRPMIRAVAALSWWVGFAEEMENASYHASRVRKGLSADEGNLAI